MSTISPEVQRKAVLSADGRYRYALRRTWDEEGGLATFVMLNPSTADASVDDPTIRRCMGFARAWGWGGIEVLNLYALRSTNPAGLWVDPDPVGSHNNVAISLGANVAHGNGWPLVAAWGAHARADRVREVVDLLSLNAIPLLCLGTTKTGMPRHPLYLRADAPLTPWRMP